MALACLRKARVLIRSLLRTCNSVARRALKSDAASPGRLQIDHSFKIPRLYSDSALKLHLPVSVLEDSVVNHQILYWRSEAATEVVAFPGKELMQQAASGTMGAGSSQTSAWWKRQPASAS